TAMQVRGFSPRTHQAYLQAVQGLAKYYRQPPDRLDQDQVSRYLEYLACERQLSASSCRQAFHAIRFLLVQVLKRDELEVAFPVPKQPQRIPELLTRAEVARILAACTNRKHHMMLEVCYGWGLWVSGLGLLRVSTTAGQRHRLGDSDLRTTVRYVHWLPGIAERGASTTDLLAQLGVGHG